MRNEKVSLADLYLPAYDGIFFGAGPYGAGVSNVLANLAAGNSVKGAYTQGKEDFKNDLAGVKEKYPVSSVLAELAASALSGGALAKLFKSGYGIAKTLKNSQKVKINFQGDTYLPKLNETDLNYMGIENRPVLLKHNTLKRNLDVHKEIPFTEYNANIEQALYKHKKMPIRDILNKDYFHFIGEPIQKGKSKSIVLLDTNPSNKNIEFVHFHKMKEKSFKKFMKRYNKKPN